MSEDALGSGSPPAPIGGGEVIPITVNGPTEAAPDGSQSVQDEHKAEAMAYAGDFHRTLAAAENLAAEEIDNFEVQDTPAGIKEKDWQKKEVDRLYDKAASKFKERRADAASFPIIRSSIIRAVEDKVYRGTEQPTTELRDLAKSSKAQAERLEDWAATLYDHPPSSDYMAEHFSKWGRPLAAEDMVLLEDKTSALRDRAEACEGKLTRLENEFQRIKETSVGVSLTMMGVLSDHLDRMTLAVGPELRREYYDLGDTDITTLKDIKDFYHKLNVMEADSHRLEAAELQKITEDVKSGDAHGYTNPKSYVASQS